LRTSPAAAAGPSIMGRAGSRTAPALRSRDGSRTIRRSSPIVGRLGPPPRRAPRLLNILRCSPGCRALPPAVTPNVREGRRSGWPRSGGGGASADTGAGQTVRNGPAPVRDYRASRTGWSRTAVVSDGASKRLVDDQGDCGGRTHTRRSSQWSTPSNSTRRCCPAPVGQRRIAGTDGLPHRRPDRSLAANFDRRHARSVRSTP
jgi:hypothetical protein